jgi:hypothetical protein
VSTSFVKRAPLRASPCNHPGKGCMPEETKKGKVHKVQTMSLPPATVVHHVLPLHFPLHPRHWPFCPHAGAYAAAIQVTDLACLFVCRNTEDCNRPWAPARHVITRPLSINMPINQTSTMLHLTLNASHPSHRLSCTRNDFRP